MSSTPTVYPHRLYPGGVVDHTDLYARASVVVNDAEEEDEARAKGFRKAYEVDAPSTGGNGGSDAAEVHSPALPGDQGGVAAASADPLPVETKAYDDGTTATGTAPLPERSPAEQLADLRAEAVALGLKPHHKAGADKLRDMIAAAKG